jgi:hypothetical protein
MWILVGVICWSRGADEEYANGFGLLVLAGCAAVATFRLF